MITHVQNKWAIDDLLDEILAEVVRRLPLIRGSVANNAVFEGHREIISKGLDHFESRDYMSATAVLYPRIEGVLRSQHARVAPGVSASQTALASSAVADPKNIRHDQSLLLPTKFRQFLETVYFAHFDPASVQDVSRNTVSHGVAPEKEMSLKAALLAVLILEQIAMLAG